MKNNYEMPEALTLGRAQSLLLGMKVVDPLGMDNEFGIGYRRLLNDIDEGDE